MFVLGRLPPNESIICTHLSGENGIIPFTINVGWYDQLGRKKRKTEHSSIRDQASNLVVSQLDEQSKRKQTLSKTHNSL